MAVKRCRFKDMESNFNQLHHLCAEDNEFLNKWAKRKGSSYIHHEMQSEMIKVMALKILRDISSDIHNADFYTIMVDEATDVSNTLQMVLCIRWVGDDLEPQEDFIGLHAMELINADATVKVIKDVLL